MRQKLHSNTVLTLESSGLSDNRSRTLLYAPHIALYHRSHVTELCCQVITEAEIPLIDTYFTQTTFSRYRIVLLCDNRKGRFLYAPQTAT
jgi:hypothetical protein